MIILYLVPIAFCICSFIPFVSNINSFRIIFIGYLIILKFFSKVTITGSIIRIKSFSIRITSYTIFPSICITGCCIKIISPCIRCMSTRVYISPQDFRQYTRCILSCISGEQACINSINRFNLSKRHYISGI